MIPFCSIAFLFEEVVDLAVVVPVLFPVSCREISSFYIVFSILFQGTSGFLLALDVGIHSATAARRRYFHAIQLSFSCIKEHCQGVWRRRFLRLFQSAFL